MNKHIWVLFVLITTSILMIGCTNSNTNTPITNKDLPRIQLPEFAPIMIGGSYIYQQYWDEVGYGKNITICQKFNCTEREDNRTIDEYALRDVLATLSNTQTKAIQCSHSENITAYDCLFFYAMLNQRSDLCDYFPDSAVFTDCIGGRGCMNQTIQYKDMCKAHVRLIKKYVESDDKITYCNTLNDTTAIFCRQFVE